MVTGSTEWFAERAKYKSSFQEEIENKRGVFISRFSPEKLADMNAKELLLQVFDNTDDTMMHLLMMDKDYRNFGASSEYAYMSIIYKGADGQWTLFEKNKHIKLSQSEAEEKALLIRNEIVNCADTIQNSILFDVEDYKILNKKLAHLSEYYNYVTFLKYYQMIFPKFFPGMYSDGTLARCMQILGLMSRGASSSKRIENMGVISIFIRNCDINNIIFNSVYADEWGWVGNRETCLAAEQNALLTRTSEDSNLNYYYFEPITDFSQLAIEIEDDLIRSRLEGKERDAIVKVRVNQSEYRKLLLRRYKKCCLCGVSDEAFLVASHIKPWSQCEPKERLDVDNGFLLCPNHDKLFDKGYISFDADGNILISERVSKQDQMFMNVRPDMRINISEKNKAYLEFHRENIYQK